MNTAIINIKTQSKIKQEAQQIAKELGISLSALINGYLRQLIRTKRVELTLDEEPSEYLKEAIQKAREQRKRGEVSPIFDNAKDAIKWLHEQSA